jgi:hypothetical protein
MRVISLGWGVQSFTLSVMAALGDIEPVDAAVHADTTYESSLTYEFADKWTPWLEERGVKIVTVKNEKSNDVIRPYGDGKFRIGIPVFTASDKGGQLRRTCTSDWKIAPLRRWLQQNRNGETVEQLIGISTDEFLRMRDSNVKYIKNVYPLIKLGISRKDCVTYLNDHNIEIPAKSACTFCPFHSTSEWRRMKQIEKDWKQAVDFDNVLRDKRPPFEIYLHPSRKPLETIDFRTEEEKGQSTFWDQECQGMCGI